MAKDDWQKVEGQGWLSLGQFGQINPRDWGPGVDKHIFTAEHPDGGYYIMRGKEASGTYEFEFDSPFVLLGGAKGPNLEMVITPLVRGQYGVRFREWQESPGNSAWSGE
ncbi:hypothetical protein [Corynebacterium meitnerae]|uniref:Uncharacterized protein n=1 Tax=Corynebacterium meitnerae TaxID=2913498 RepID=A0A9X3RKZ2_9CORY|nr:hypothetical protein [Corynebacterium meitnerae]MCZ9294636.1 hypothetical protein [Corynebacterium meitnerae]